MRLSFIAPLALSLSLAIASAASAASADPPAPPPPPPPPNPLPQEREASLLAAGQAACDDGLYIIAARRLNEVLTRGSPDARLHAALLLGRVHLAQNNVPAARTLLAAHHPDEHSPLAPSFAFLRAQTEAASGHWNAVLSLLAPFDNTYQNDPLLPRVSWLRVRALGALGRFDDAHAICHALLTAASPPAPTETPPPTPPHPLFPHPHVPPDTAATIAPAACLDFATACTAAREYDLARNMLHTISTTWPASSWSEQADLKLLALQTAENTPLPPEPSPTNAPPILPLPDSDSPALSPATRVKRLLVIADSLAAKTNWAGALATLDRALAIPCEPPLQLETRLLQGRILLRSGDVPAGARQIRQAIAEIPTPDRAAPLQLQLADALANMGEWNAAATEYQIWLGAFENRPELPHALAGLAWALWEDNRPAEAAPLFLRAAEGIPNPAEKPLLLLKAGDSFSAAGLYDRAIPPYRAAAAQQNATPDLRDRATYQLAECLLLHDAPADGKALLESLAQANPNSPFAPKAALRLAALYQSQHNPTAALAQYARIAATPSWPQNDRAEALRARGMIRHAAGNPAAAFADFSRICQDFPATPAAESAAYMRAWCLLALDRPADAAQAFTHFAASHPHSPLRVDALFWLGENAYNSGDPATAEARFAALAAEYPASPRAPEALYWAGRAAAAQREFLRANEHFNALMSACPTNPLLPRVLLAQGDVLAELGHFEAAILAFEEVIVSFPSSPEAPLAWGRKGDCQYTLGATDPARREEALLSYRTLADLPAVPADLRLQALYKIARYMEKAGHVAAAFDHYMNVVYSFLQLPAPPPEATVWFTRAAFAAAAIRERAGDWREAAGIYRRLADSNVPASPEALDRANAICRDYWITLPKD